LSSEEYSQRIAERRQRAINAAEAKEAKRASKGVTLGQKAENVSTTVGKRTKTSILPKARAMSDVVDEIPVGLTPEERAEIFYQMDETKRPDLSSLPQEDIDAIKQKAYELDTIEEQKAAVINRQKEIKLAQAEARGRSRVRPKSAPKKSTSPTKAVEDLTFAADDALSSMTDESIDALGATIGEFVEVGDEVFDSLGATAFEDLTPASAAVSARVSAAGRAGKAAASSVATRSVRGSSSGSLSAARSVAESVSGYTNNMSANQLKMAALGLAVGGLGVGYANRRRKRR
jgi:hypothetical protein